MFRLYYVELLLAGGEVKGAGHVNTILEYDATSDSYTEAGTMTQARAQHALSVVQYEEYSQWCQ